MNVKTNILAMIAIYCFGISVVIFALVAMLCCSAIGLLLAVFGLGLIAVIFSPDLMGNEGLYFLIEAFMLYIIPSALLSIVAYFSVNTAFDELHKSIRTTRKENREGENNGKV